ncbi:hypothetical protein M3Y99_01272900 [Aphelenchoides fujianensis]|nr:hypothetical protein M3Y99_01272900 [Aphelenchoides fujianensis]
MEQLQQMNTSHMSEEERRRLFANLAAIQKSRAAVTAPSAPSAQPVEQTKTLVKEKKDVSSENEQTPEEAEKTAALLTANRELLQQIQTLTGQLQSGKVQGGKVDPRPVTEKPPLGASMEQIAALTAQPAGQKPESQERVRALASVEYITQRLRKAEEQQQRQKEDPVVQKPPTDAPMEEIAAPIAQTVKVTTHSGETVNIREDTYDYTMQLMRMEQQQEGNPAADPPQQPVAVNMGGKINRQLCCDLFVDHSNGSLVLLSNGSSLRAVQNERPALECAAVFLRKAALIALEIVLKSRGVHHVGVPRCPLRSMTHRKLKRKVEAIFEPEQKQPRSQKKTEEIPLQPTPNVKPDYRYAISKPEKLVRLAWFARPSAVDASAFAFCLH